MSIACYGCVDDLNMYATASHSHIYIQLQPFPRKNFGPIRRRLINTLSPVSPPTTGQWPCMAVSITSTRMRRRHILISLSGYSKRQENFFSPMRCMLINTLRAVTPLVTGQWPAMAVSMISTRMRRLRIPWSAFSYNQCQENIFPTMRCMLINKLKSVTYLTTGQWPAMAVSMT